VHDRTAETWREEGIHDSSCGGQRLPSLVSSDQSERIYAMRAEGTAQSLLLSGEKTGLKRSFAPSSPKMPMNQEVVARVVLPDLRPSSSPAGDPSVPRASPRLRSPPHPFPIHGCPLRVAVSIPAMP
jgi:hypothetical protein